MNIFSFCRRTIFILTLWSLPLFALELVTNVGTNVNKIAFFDEAQKRFTAQSGDSLYILHTRDPFEFSREVEFRFLLYTPNSSPDIFMPTNNIRFNRLDVTKEITDWYQISQTFHPAVVVYLKQEKLNLFPLEISTFVIFYNKKIFRELNIDVPAQGNFLLDDFLRWCDHITKRSRNLYCPLVMGMKGDDFRKGTIFLMYMILRFLGPEKTTRFLNGQLEWNDTRLINAIKMVQIISKNYNTFNRDFASISDLEAQERFKSKKAAMYLASTEYLSSDNQPSEMGVLPFFNLKESNIIGNDYLFLDITTALCINQNTTQSAQCKQFLDYLQKQETIQLWNKMVKTLTGIKSTGSGYNSTTWSIYQILNNNPTIPFSWSIEEISNDYSYQAWDILQKCVTKQYVSSAVDTMLNSFHEKVKKNGWYR